MDTTQVIGAPVVPEDTEVYTGQALKVRLDERGLVLEDLIRLQSTIRSGTMYGRSGRKERRRMKRAQDQYGKTWYIPHSEKPKWVMMWIGSVLVTSGLMTVGYITVFKLGTLC